MYGVILINICVLQPGPQTKFMAPPYRYEKRTKRVSETKREKGNR